MKYKLHLLIVFTLLGVGIAPFFGTEFINPFVLGEGASTENLKYIFYELRLPRVIAGFFVGGALGLCGMVFQALFCNELASPYTLGVAGGASLGAAFAVQAGYSFFILTFPATACFAFIGALLSTLFIFFLSRYQNGRLNIVLIGIALSYFTSALLMLTQYVSDPAANYRIVRWLMGSLDAIRFQEALLLIPFCLVGFCAVYILAPELDLLACGSDIAITRGLNVQKSRSVFFLITSILVGLIVAVCGPLGFIGLVGPHIARIFMGSKHHKLTISTFFISGAFLVVCDALARTCIAPAQMPVGILTSFLGAPFFLFLLFGKKNLGEK